MRSKSKLNGFFYREPSKNWGISKYCQDLQNIFSYKNIEKIKKRQIKKCFFYREEQNFLSYRFSVLKKWMILNERYTYHYFRRLDIVLSKLYLDNELNSYELEYINRVKSIIFAWKRNLKALIVDIPLEASETIYYKYSNGDIVNSKNIDQADKWRTQNNSECYISNKRICLMNNWLVSSIYFSQVKNFQFTKHYLIFYLKNNETYFITCQDNYVFYTSLLRIMQYKNIRFDD